MVCFPLPTVESHCHCKPSLLLGTDPVFLLERAGSYSLYWECTSNVGKNSIHPCSTTDALVSMAGTDSVCCNLEEKKKKKDKFEVTGDLGPDADPDFLDFSFLPNNCCPAHPQALMEAE